MEAFLRQLEAQIERMAPPDRAAVVEHIKAALAVLGRYGVPQITGAAIFKFLGVLGIASASDGMAAFWIKVRAKAAATGPHVGTLFSAL